MIEKFYIVISQHTEESSFLWLLRNNAANAPHYSLKDLAKLDGRVEAHIDGLRVAGDEGWELCKEELSWEDSGEIFTASLLAFESGKEERIDEVLKVGAQNWELGRGMVSALGWLPYSAAKKYIDKYLADPLPLLRQVGIAASAIHRQNPYGETLINALKDEDVLLKCRALKAVGELGKIDLMNTLKMNFESKDSNISLTAAKSAALLGDKNAPFLIKLRFSEVDPKVQEDLIKVGFRKFSLYESKKWFNELNREKEQLRLAVISAGAAGDPVNVPWLIEMMKIDEHARVAGEAFTMITGIDLAYDDLDGEWPEGFEAGPTENPEDENVEMDADEDLPWPEPELIAKRWESIKSQFKQGTRYLIGKPIAQDWLQQVLRMSKQRQRAAASLELTTFNPGQPLFEVRAPGFRQQQILKINV